MGYRKGLFLRVQIGDFGNQAAIIDHRAHEPGKGSKDFARSTHIEPGRVLKDGGGIKVGRAVLGKGAMDEIDFRGIEGGKSFRGSIKLAVVEDHVGAFIKLPGIAKYLPVWR